MAQARTVRGATGFMTLTLDPMEVEALFQLTRHVAGDKTSTRRKHIDRIHTAMSDISQKLRKLDREGHSPARGIVTFIEKAV